jgi:hypothetical protein
MQQDQALFGLSMAAARKRFAVCLRNEGYEVSLEKRKIYEVLADPDAAEHDQIRVIDESGEDYRYPEEFFAEIDLPQPLRRALAASV